MEVNNFDNNILTKDDEMMASYIKLKYDAVKSSYDNIHRAYGFLMTSIGLIIAFQGVLFQITINISRFHKLLICFIVFSILINLLLIAFVLILMRSRAYKKMPSDEIFLMGTNKNLMNYHFCLEIIKIYGISINKRYKIQKFLISIEIVVLIIVFICMVLIAIN